MNIIKTFINLIKSINLEIKELTTPPVMRAIFISSLILIITMFAILIAYFNKLPPQVPLYYSKPWGEEQLTSPLMLFILPVGSFIWLILSFLLIHFQAKEYRVFSQLVLIVHMIVSLMALLTELNIIHLVT